jgi:SM-20-related protein
MTRVIQLPRIHSAKLRTDPFMWAAIDGLYSQQDAAELARSYPSDHFKSLQGHDTEKGWEYESRELVGMGAKEASFVEYLSPVWGQLAADLVSAEYRSAMSALTGLDLAAVPIEINVFHYGPGAWLGPHVDLTDKLVTHVLYFNKKWNACDGGCLQILRSQNAAEVAAEVNPTIGNSSVIVRSELSWHAVARVREGMRLSRRSVTVTFYRPGSISTMWPPGESPVLHDCHYRDGGSALFNRIRERLL